MLKLLICVFFTSYSFSQKIYRTYSQPFDWGVDSSQVKNISLDSGYLLFKFNDLGKLIQQSHFNKDSLLLLDVSLTGIDTLLLDKPFKDSLESDIMLMRESGEIGEVQPLVCYVYYETAKTFYTNGILRSSYTSNKEFIVSKNYSKKGKLLYQNLIKINTNNRDTVDGIFKVGSYYDWIKYDIVENGEKQIQVQVPIHGYSHKAINDSVDSNLQNDCNQDFCVTKEYQTISNRKLRKYLKIIRIAIENDLITDLNACYYQ